MTAHTDAARVHALATILFQKEVWHADAAQALGLDHSELNWIVIEARAGRAHPVRPEVADALARAALKRAALLNEAAQAIQNAGRRNQLELL